MKISNLLIVIAFIAVSILALLAFGDPQWSRYVYIFQARIYPANFDHGIIGVPSDYSGLWVDYSYDDYNRRIHVVGEANYLNGVLHGTSTTYLYDKSGNLVPFSTETFDHGELIKSYSHDKKNTCM